MYRLFVPILLDYWILCYSNPPTFFSIIIFSLQIILLPSEYKHAIISHILKKKRKLSLYTFPSIFHATSLSSLTAILLEKVAYSHCLQFLSSCLLWNSCESGFKPLSHRNYACQDHQWCNCAKSNGHYAVITILICHKHFLWLITQPQYQNIFLTMPPYIQFFCFFLISYWPFPQSVYLTLHPLRTPLRDSQGLTIHLLCWHWFPWWAHLAYI